MDRDTPKESIASSERNFCSKCSAMLWLYDETWLVNSRYLHTHHADDGWQARVVAPFRICYRFTWPPTSRNSGEYSYLQVSGLLADPILFHRYASRQTRSRRTSVYQKETRKYIKIMGPIQSKAGTGNIVCMWNKEDISVAEVCTIV